ncbi:MAG: bifunctional folylpolyglutamate synthase/dihydrofolate synthase [Candidatus Aenigmarchaeota archaeon]|nr:bifunctional folylpolyglutamate synthase/dihydrofolate synthase [Candidatus Aenigmarchaeota archaeon]
MNYAEATGYIQRLNKFGMKLGLERVERLLELLGNPQKSFRSILVGGTSGKGSTTVMIGSVLREAGYRTGVFVKPHLSDFRERISVDGKMIPESDFVRLVGKIKPLAERMSVESEGPTFFEFITAVAFEYFCEQRVQFAAVEVGLGGRLDATNTLIPDVCIITHVSLEHTNILGDTVEKIAREKAGIIKRGCVLVTADKNKDVLRLLEKTCAERGAKFLRAPEIRNAISTSAGNEFIFEGESIFVALAGRFQLENIACALAAIRSLGEIPVKAIKKGLANTKWPGRFELVSKRPFVLLDGAKDVASTRSLTGSLNLIKYNKLYTVFGVSDDKLFPEMLRELAGATDFFIFTKHKMLNRGVEPSELARYAGKQNKNFIIVNDVKDAVRKAMKLAGKNDLVLVTGSLFTVGEAREIWFRKKSRMGREFNENVKVATERNRQF